MKRVLIVGSGFSGAVCASRLADVGIPSLVIDQRDHIGGNCHTERDDKTGIMIHKYGPHIFNTNHQVVWDFVNQYGSFGPFVNRVKAMTKRGVFGLPINLHTINQFYGKSFSPDEAKSFIDSLGDKSIKEPQNFEEQALRFLGRDLYETFFYGYTKKQWGVEPTELPASILKRLPVRFNYDDNYYNKTYQGIPYEGYSSIIERILDHKLIEVKCSTPFEHAMKEEFLHTVYTGPMDLFYQYSKGRMGYRTVYWEKHEHEGDFQGVAGMNYPELDDPHTRIYEHKHFTPWETHQRTLAYTEYSKETSIDDIPYYPKRLSSDKTILASYEALAQEEETVSFIGRLGTYRYMDMDLTILEGMNFGDALGKSLLTNSKRPVFPSDA